TRLKQTREESDRAPKPVNFGHDQRHLMHSRRSQSLFPHWPVGAFPALNFGERGNDAPVATVQVCRDRLALRFDAKTALALLAAVTMNPTRNHRNLHLRHRRMTNF